MRNGFLLLHIAAGATALLLGPLAALAPRLRMRRALAIGYQAAVAGLEVGALGMAFM